MSSQYMSQNSENSGTVQTVVNVMIRKEGDYRDGIAANISMLNSSARRLVADDTIDRLLKQHGDEEDPLQKERDQLKDLMKANIDRDDGITIFLKSLQQIGDNCHDENTENYQKELERRMKEVRRKSKRRSKGANGDDYYKKHKSYQALCEKLGEPVDTSGIAQGDGEDEEEELMVMNTGASEINLKCPLMGTLMEDPVKNQVCGHVYSSEAIRSHIQRATRKQCPVPGCSNTRLAVSQLKPDREMAILVRREKKRQQQERDKQQRNTQTDFDSDDETRNK
eukprot:CAMPEP_0198119048 /NCGR_PEP_ID=MMETSP1442-20131203/24108_1 /TAXON_ID= /ORGANISM="Craspedostauros australis, Strain CCMP3328" /LENGTH=280 /DNA_ID=CAMNT_0043777433 /DNA_START=10 /DNA_END=852 /DNA_ORIENTATION=-